MKNEVQKFLRDGWTLDSLKEKYGIDAKRHRTYNNLVLFKYSQIDSPMGELVVQHARGVILDEANNWEIVAWPFNKFFNHEEGHAAKIDWKTARVFEKLDGSLAIVYYYDGKWHMATSGTPDAGGEVNGFNMSFAEYFWQTMDKTQPELYAFLNKGAQHSRHLTFCFELMGPFNRIVVNHAESKLALLGVRNNLTGEELPVETANIWLNGLSPMVKVFDLSSVEGIVATFETMSPLSQEGYVIVDDNFNRVKVKHPGYVALHHAKDGMSNKAFVEIVRNGETSEVLTAFPEFRPLMDDAQRRYDIFMIEIMADYERIKHIEVQKDFALQAVKTRCSAALFSVRAKKSASLKDFVKDMQIDRLLEYLGYKE